MQAGDIRLVWFPFSQHEGASYKKRPVLILSVTGQPRTPERAILVAMITGNASRYAQPSAGDIPIQDWQASGLDRPSTVRARRIWTAEDRDFVGANPFGRVSPAVFQQVEREVRSLLPGP